jgi:hypothetical protein
MTSKQLGHQVCKAVSGLDLSELPMDGRQELCDTINLTLAEWLQMLPADRRVMPFGAAVQHPILQVVNIVQGARGFLYVSGTPYPAGGFASEENALGSSAILEGSAVRNQLQQPGSLLLPYQGATSSSVRMSLYADAVHLPADTWQVAGDVMITSPNSGEGQALRYNPHRPAEYRDNFTGQPREWWMEPLTPLREEDSRKFVLRLWPAPDRFYTLHIPIGIFPQAFVIEDFFENRSLPLNPLEASLMTMMAKGAFLTSSFVSEAANVSGIQNGAASARTQMQNLQRPLSTQPEFLGTPHGF